jgi:hypothetical protein
MSRITASLGIIAIVVSTCADVSAGHRRGNRFRMRHGSPCVGQSYHRGAAPASCTPGTTGAAAETAHQSSETSGKTTPAPHDVITAQEKEWYNQMLEMKYIEADFAQVWKDDSHADRKEFYLQIMEAHQKGQAAKAADAASNSGDDATSDNPQQSEIGLGKDK